MRTQREFFAALAECKNGWEIIYSGAVRHIGVGEMECPVTGVVLAETGQRFGIGFFQDAAESIGMDEDLAWRIAEAADYKRDCPEPRLRKRILAALGLSE